MGWFADMMKEPAFSYFKLEWDEHDPEDNARALKIIRAHPEIMESIRQDTLRAIEAKSRLVEDKRVYGQPIKAIEAKCRLIEER